MFILTTQTSADLIYRAKHFPNLIHVAHNLLLCWDQYRDEEDWETDTLPVTTKQKSIMSFVVQLYDHARYITDFDSTTLNYLGGKKTAVTQCFSPHKLFK